MKAPPENRTQAPAGAAASLDKKSVICFQCRPGLPCFTACCQDVNIFLSAYDILRLKHRLGLPSSEFLSRYTKTLISSSGKLPLVQLKMEGQEKRCPFVTAEGCTVYEDRPWACRMYPLDRTDDGGKFFFIAPDHVCLGRRESARWTVEEWLLSQEIGPYEDMDRKFQIVTGNPRLLSEGLSDPKLQQMFWMASYDLDTFRRFVFESRFLQKFELEPETIELVRTDDVALLHLALRWLQFGLVCADVLPIREEVRKEKMERAGKAKGSGGES